MQITNYQISLNGSTWRDVSSKFTQDAYPDMLPDDLAIQNSLYNLFNCPIGARGRIFEPEYGSLWYQYLNEPIDIMTANSMWVSMIQAISRWEPRITLDNSGTSIVPDLTIPGYVVTIKGTDPISSQSISISFTAQP